MSDESDESQGQGEDQNNQGDDDQKDVIELSKEELSNKIIGGRNEGIEKGQRDALGAINSALGTEYESLDDASEDLSGKSIGDVEESDVVTELQSKIQEKDEKISNLSGKIQDIRTEQGLKESVSEELGDSELSLPFDEVRTLVDSKFGYVEKDGVLYATKDGERFINDSGEYTTYAEAFNNYVQSRGLVDSEASGGTGGKTNTNSGNDKSDNPWVTGNATEQAKIFRDDPAKARRLKKQAGN